MMRWGAVPAPYWIVRTHVMICYDTTDVKKKWKISWNIMILILIQMCCHKFSSVRIWASILGPLIQNHPGSWMSSKHSYFGTLKKNCWRKSKCCLDSSCVVLSEGTDVIKIWQAHDSLLLDALFGLDIPQKSYTILYIYCLFSNQHIWVHRVRCTFGFTTLHIPRYSMEQKHAILAFFNQIWWWQVPPHRDICMLSARSGKAPVLAVEILCYACTKP